MGVELTFESMDDFSPDAIARKVEPLRKLLESRERLQNLKLWCESNRVPEGELTELLKDEAKLKALMASPPPPNGGKPEA
jgi:type VI secretion system protein ImpB